MMLRAPDATTRDPTTLIAGVSHEADRHVNLLSSCGAGKLVVHRKLQKKKTQKNQPQMLVQIQFGPGPD